jgi:type I restriction enzyme M protein
MQFEEFRALIEWWEQREENERAWKVSAADVLKYNGNGGLVSANLDLKNPNAAQDLEHLPPEELVESIIEKERQIAALMDEIKKILDKEK